MKMPSLFVALLTSTLFCGALSCGGSKSGGGTGPGQSHSTADGDGPSDDIDSETGGSFADAGATSSEPQAPVTFVITNSHSEDLSLNMDKGWQAVISAYSGQVPNAKSMLMFPTHCTASCDSAPEEICPVCEELVRAKDIKAAEKHDEVAPGESREVPWDGMAFTYKKAKGTRDGKKARCECYETVEPQPETYTIQACGLRKTKTSKERSKYQCVQSTLTLPVTEPVVVELDFGKPAK